MFVFSFIQKLISKSKSLMKGLSIEIEETRYIYKTLKSNFEHSYSSTENEIRIALERLTTKFSRIFEENVASTSKVAFYIEKLEEEKIKIQEIVQYSKDKIDVLEPKVGIYVASQRIFGNDLIDSFIKNK